MQLLDLHQEGLRPLDRRADRVPAAHAIGQYRVVHVQYESREASILPELRRRVVLYSALRSRSNRRQRAMPRRGESGEAGTRAFRRAQLGESFSGTRARPSREVTFGVRLMATLGFLRRDFEVFAIEDFSARLAKIDELVTPRLMRL